MTIGANTQKKVAFISSYMPRKCGIATFTSDLINSVAPVANGEFEPLVIAMQSSAELEYKKPVELKIRKSVKYDYVSAADYINFSDVDVVSVQHEFGLFGGDGGSYLSLLLGRLNKPVVTTLHTVLEQGPKKYFDSLTDVCQASDKVIVMNSRGIKMLRDIYGVPERKIKLIPHGIPNLPFADSSHYKRKLGLTGCKVILTFGLLSKNKGIEVMLKALPAIIKADPSVLYIVLGAIHPEVIRREGQSYKFKLESMVMDLGLQKNVVFHNRFVNNEQLLQFLGAADVYVTPYLHKEQLTSAQGRGKLVQFGDSENIARSIVEILSNNSLFLSMRRRAYEYGRSMTWPKVAQAYWKLFGTFAPSAPVSLRPELGLRDWKVPAYTRQQIYQSA
jgi:glycosyltransferase involved in cell wall biosynthesis